jgi:mono/diheme cytochrome c family protein
LSEARKHKHATTQRRPNLGWLFVALILAAATATVWSIARQSAGVRADPGDAKQVALGKAIYDRHCASCHGANLEGQPQWQSRLPTGRMPAPPHDASGHTWHHPDELLFGMTKDGLVPGKYAPPGYQSDMPAFGNTLSDDEIWAVLAYINSRWPREIQQAQRERRHVMR